MLKFTTLKKAKELTGLSYIGKINHSSKHAKAYKFNELVYTIYLAPANKSGYEVCPGRSKECTELCLNESGRNRHLDKKLKKIDNSRTKKTQLFFEHHQFFMEWVIHEIHTGINRARKLGYRFSVRLNNTSDISPEMFTYTNPDNGMRSNLLQLFPEVQFYDYTKVPGRIQLMKKYSNYDVTFSYDGFNGKTCQAMLKDNIRIAVVFNKVPEMFWGYPVIDGDLYDMRYLDPSNVIVGLKYKKVRKQLTENYKFVVS